jgi:hypothetical protein
MARDLALSNGRLLVMFEIRRVRITNLADRPRETMAEQLHPSEYVRTVQEYVERHAHANLCSTCGQTMHPPARRSDRQTVMVQA